MQNLWVKCFKVTRNALLQIQYHSSTSGSIAMRKIQFRLKKKVENDDYIISIKLALMDIKFNKKRFPLMVVSQFPVRLSISI